MSAAPPRSERRAGGYAGPRGAGLCCRIGVRGTCVAGGDKPPSITERKGTGKAKQSKATDGKGPGRTGRERNGHKALRLLKM